MNKNLKIAIWVLVVVIVAVTLIKTTYNKASSQVVRIGAVLPLTGGLADLGNAQKQGMQLAVKELNAKSKIKYELMIEDGKADPKSSLDSANFLVSVKNAPIIITSFRGASLSVASGLEKSKVVILAHTATADGSPVTKQGSNFIPMGAEMTNAGRSVGIYAKNNASCTAIGSVVEDTDASKLKLVGFKDAFGTSTKYFENLVPINSMDYRTVISKLKSEKVNCLYVEIRPNVLTSFLKQAKEMNFNPKKFSNSYSITAPLLEDNTFKDTLEGLIYSINVLPNTQITNDFKTAYKTEYNKDANDFSSLTYDFVYMIDSAVKTCGSTDNICLAKTIRSNNPYNGVSGIMSFNEFGEGVQRDYVLKTISGGKFVDVK